MATKITVTYIASAAGTRTKTYEGSALTATTDSGAITIHDGSEFVAAYSAQAWMAAEAE